MQEQIGSAAGKIWHALEAEGELSLVRLRRATDGKAPVFDWAIGWLAREGKIVITAEKRTFRLRLRRGHE